MIHYRTVAAQDAELLEDYLYLALHQPNRNAPIARSAVRTPQLAIYTANWGRTGDAGVLAVSHSGDDAAPSSPDSVVGIAWARILADKVRGYGNLDEDTPELAISVKPPFRGDGIGSELIQQLTQRLAAQGYARVSLSVQKTNPAHRLYRRLGFSVHEERTEDWVMVLDLRTL